jgi:hypothetical protein
MTVPKRFDILRFFSGLLKVLAWINLVLAILSAIGMALAGGQLGPFLELAGAQFAPMASMIAGFGGIVLAVFVLLGGLFYFVLLYALGEMISLQIAVEENTRLTAALLLKMHQDSQVDTRPAAAYPGAFANEPAPYK